MLFIVILFLECKDKEYILIKILHLLAHYGLYLVSISLYLKHYFISLYIMLDTISIVVISGAGGDGCAAARRESGVPF